jgi:hypothetical protein
MESNRVRVIPDRSFDERRPRPNQLARISVLALQAIRAVELRPSTFEFDRDEFVFRVVHALRLRAVSMGRR